MNPILVCCKTCTHTFFYIGNVCCVHETKYGFWIGLGGFWSIWKNALEEKPKGLKIGMIGFKPPTREHRNKFYNDKIGIRGFL